MKIRIDKLRQEIGRLGITLKEFSERCGVSRQTFYNYWENPKNYNPKIIDKIAKELGLEGKDLIR